MDAADDDHPDEQKFLKLLESFRFADRYYAYCGAHAAEGPDLPPPTQTAALAETGRTFRYQKKEKFFAWRDAKAPADCELGLNVSLENGQAEWILVFKTPSGHLGSPFSALATEAKRLSTPSYRHTPPNPVPNITSQAELGEALDQGLALYDELATMLAAQTWR
jgi:hypothetical protein